jgi:hypothetical protein
MSPVEFLKRMVDIPAPILSEALEMEQEYRQNAYMEGMIRATPHKSFSHYKDFDFSSWKELYEYILESKMNGQHKQSKELYKGLSDRHKVEYIDWLRETLFYDDMPKLKEFQQIINYYGN